MNSSTSNNVSDKLTSLVERSLLVQPDQCFRGPFDPEWRSPSEISNDGETCLWKPIPQSPVVDFSGLANAAEADIHPDIQAYYQCYWAGTIEADAAEGPVSLIQLWNQEDFERLIENLIGHLLMKNRARLPFTVFFATTDPNSEHFLSIDNTTGEVYLEEPGRPPLRKVANHLGEIIDRLTPATRTPGIY